MCPAIRFAVKLKGSQQSTVVRDQFTLTHRSPKCCVSLCCSRPPFSAQSQNAQSQQQCRVARFEPFYHNGLVLALRWFPWSSFGFFPFPTRLPALPMGSKDEDAAEEEDPEAEAEEHRLPGQNELRQSSIPALGCERLPPSRSLFYPFFGGGFPC